MYQKLLFDTPKQELRLKLPKLFSLVLYLNQAFQIYRRLLNLKQHLHSSLKYDLHNFR